MQPYTGGSQWNDDSINDEWVECPRCRYPMLPLRSYEIEKVAEYPSIEADGVTFLLWGWMVFVGQIVYHFLAGLFTFEARKKKLVQVKRDILPRFPNSLVCPKCLNTVTRR